MTDSAPRQRRRILLKLFLSFCVLVIVVFGLLGWYITTDSFQQWARQRVVSSAEELTGGRVELGELHTIPFRLRIDVRNLTIHGREGTGQQPFLHVDRVQAEMKIISLLSKTVALHALEMDHPVAHIITYLDGTTNAPIPKGGSYSSDEGPVEQLISLRVSHIEVRQGEVLWQDEKIPLDFDARDLAVLLNYSLLRRRYEAHVAAGAIDTHIQKYPGFVWQADASLLLSRGRADISSLTVTSGKSEIHFNGALKDFSNPQIDGEYHGTADLGEIARLTRQNELRRGTAQFSGKGSWNLREFSSQGTVQSKDLEWANEKLSIKNGRFDTVFALTPERFRLTSVKASLLGGDLRGDADILNWQSSLAREQKPRERRTIGRVSPESIQRGSVHLQLAAFPIMPALNLLSTKKLPLDHLKLSGNASGNVDMLWVGTIRDAETRLKLGLAPYINPGPNEIPVHGQIDGVYRGSRDELEVSHLVFTTPGSEITASGNLAATSSLQFSFTSHNLKELLPLIEAEYGSPKLPFSIHGWASLTGNASGKLSAFSVNGNLQVYDFDTTLPSKEGNPPRTVHWDALSTAVQYSSNHFAAHNGSIIHGHATGHFDGSIALARNGELSNAPFTLHLDLSNADVPEVLRLAGLDQPSNGTLTLTASLSGTPSDPQGNGHIEVHNGSGYGVVVPTLTSDLQLVSGELQFNNINARAYDAILSGSGAISISPVNSANGTVSENRAFHLNLSGSNLALARLPKLQSERFALDGLVDFTAKASGTTGKPSVEAHIHVKNLALDQERAGDLNVDASTEGRLLTLKVRSDFDKADLNLDGSVTLERDFLADLTLAFHNVDADSILRSYFPGKITGHSPLVGTVQLRGPLREPRQLKAQAEIQSFSADIEHIQIQSVEPLRFEISDENLLVEQLHLTGSGTDFTAHGKVHLTGAREIDFHADGAVNLTLLQSLNPKIQARGTLGVNVNASGSVKDPVLQGRLEVKNTFLSHNDFPSGLSDLNGVLHFDRNRIQIETLQGTTGGGTIALSGSATYQGSGVLALDVGATANGVRLRYPPGVSSTANADLRLTGTTNAALLSGDVTITKLAVTPGFDFGAYIEKSKQAVVFTQGDTLESRLRLDVHVVTTPDLQMQTAIARLSGDADLRVRGTADRPAILGRVEVLEGEISFNGTKYKLERGEVTFANPAKTQPIIDMRATTRVRDYDITVQFRGDASVTNGLKVTWQSEPQLPEADVIALLALGRTREESAAAGNSGSFGFGGDASNLLINEALNSTVNSRLQRLFGASRVKIDPQGLVNETNLVHGPQVTVEQQVANNLTLTYSTNVSVSNQQIIQVEYNITRNISIVALRDQNGVVSFDFKLRRRHK